MFLAIKGIRNCRKEGHDTIFFVTFVGYLLVGTGSFFFHTTLKCTWENQRQPLRLCTVDEI